MKSKRIILSLLCLILFPLVYAHSEKSIRSINDALAAYKSGHIEFAAGNYDKAVRKYASVENYLSKNPKHKKFFDHHLRGFSMTEMVKRHRSLKKFTPVHTHRIAAIFINRTDTVYKGKPIKSEFQAEDFEAAQLSQKICKKYMEVMTAGKVTLRFYTAGLNSSVTRIEPVSQYDKRQTPEIIIDSISPNPSGLIKSLAEKNDTLVFYWTHKNSNGKTPYDQSHGWGGAYRVPIIPHYIYTPLRGRILLSTGLAHRPGTLFHELFHTIEKVYGIKPLHGFRDPVRKDFPLWKGNGEFDYYQYHIKMLIKNDELRSFMISKRYLFNPSVKITDPGIKKIKNSLNEQSATALKLYFKARHFQKTSPKKTIKLLKKAITTAPYFSPALLQLGSILYTQKKYTPSEEYISRAYNTDPNNPEACYMYGVIKNRNKKTRDSIRLMTEALTVNPGFAKAYQYRGFLYYQSGKKTKAEKDFAKAIDLNVPDKKWIPDYLREKASKGDTEAKEILSRLMRR